MLETGRSQDTRHSRCKRALSRRVARVAAALKWNLVPPAIGLPRHRSREGVKPEGSARWAGQRTSRAPAVELPLPCFLPTTQEFGPLEAVKFIRP